MSENMTQNNTYDDENSRTLNYLINNFLKLYKFIRDKIEHDGTVPTTGEVLSATTDRLIVLRWLELLHPSLPNHVSNVFTLDLQTKSLKNLQSRINEQINDLLFQVNK